MPETPYGELNPEARSEIEEILAESEKKEDPLPLEPQTKNLLQENFSWLGDKPRELLSFAAALQDRRFRELRNQTLGKERVLDEKNLKEFSPAFKHLRDRYSAFYQDPNNAYLQEIEETLGDAEAELRAAAETHGWDTAKAWALLETRVSAFTNRAVIKSLSSETEFQMYQRAIGSFLQLRNLELSGILALRAEQGQGPSKETAG